jgi:hypothetical protein
MKEEDIKVDYDQHQMMVYAEKSDGSYGATKTGSFTTKNYLDDYLEKQVYFHQTYLESVRKGETSPISYYMSRMELTPAEVASRIGMREGAVRRHMTAKGFAAARLAQLVRYAVLFGIPVAKLFALTDPFNRSLVLDFQPTAQPAVSVLNITPAPTPPARPQ